MNVLPGSWLSGQITNGWIGRPGNDLRSIWSVEPGTPRGSVDLDALFAGKATHE